MSRNLKSNLGLLASAILLSACAAEPTYSPPERSRAADSCPIGEVWVCRDHYPSRLERPGKPPMDCTCEYLQGVR